MCEFCQLMHEDMHVKNDTVPRKINSSLFSKDKTCYGHQLFYM
jgi:hypothetical protein